jgi:hypothetical protein
MIPAPIHLRRPSRRLVAGALVTWLAIVVCMIVNGIVREGVVAPRVGAGAADVLSAASGIAIILLVTRPFVRSLGAASAAVRIRVAVAWLALSVAFEFLFGHFVAGDSWASLAAAYDITRGELWPLVLASVAAAPFLWRAPRAARRSR